MKCNTLFSKGMTQSQIRLTYQLMLGRSPSRAEIAAWKAQKVTPEIAHRRFLQSAEFRRKFIAPPQKPPAASASEAPHRGPHDVADIRNRQCLDIRIPKTAGTTLTAHLRKSYPIEQLVPVFQGVDSPVGTLSPRQLRDGRYFFGHLTYDAVACFPTRPLVICMLRQPVARLVSYYGHILHKSEHPLHKAVAGAKMDFGDFLEFCETRSRDRLIVDNAQIRIMSGDSVAQVIGEEERTFDTALINIFHPDTIVGLTEYFDAFQNHLVRLGLLSRVSPERLNTSTEKGYAATRIARATAALSPRQRDILERFTHWDARLYEICRRTLRDRGLLGLAP